MKIIQLPKKEMAAWILLLCAALLLSFSVAIAQDKKTDSSSSIHIKIEKNENGKKTSIDTTVSKDQLPELKEYLKDSGIDFDMDGHGFSFNEDFSSSGDTNIIIRRHGSITKEQREKFKMDMSKLHQEMKKLKNEMKDIHIEIYGDDSKDHENFNFDMNIPDFHCMPHVYMYKDEDDNEDSPQKHHSFKYNYSFNDDIPDSLNNDEHVIIRGKEGEGKPELEKEITGKKGEKVFIFKRKLPKKEISTNTNTSVGINRVKVYPNPSNGKISISFNAETKGNLSISISDARGKEVFSDKKNDFKGEYFNQVDLSSKSKGTYFIKISHGDDSITKKIMVE